MSFDHAIECEEEGEVPNPNHWWHVKGRLIRKRETYKRDDEIEGGREVSGGEEERHPNGDRSGKKTSDLPHLLHDDGAIDRSLALRLFDVRLQRIACACTQTSVFETAWFSNLSPLCMKQILRASSHTRLRARDQYTSGTSSTLIGGKGGARPSSLHAMLKGDQRSMWMQDGYKVYMDLHMVSNDHVSWSLKLSSNIRIWWIFEYSKIYLNIESSKYIYSNIQIFIKSSNKWYFCIHFHKEGANATNYCVAWKWLL